MSQGTSSVSEVPLIYPCHEVSTTKRYIVSETDGTFHRAIDGTDSSEEFYDGSIERLHGSASISSSLWFGNQQFDVVTSALIQAPNVLTVMLSLRGVGPLRSVELDLGSGIHSFSSAISIRCFADSESTIRMVLVDFKGVIMSLRLELETLTPMQSSLEICSVPDLLEHPDEMADSDYVFTETELNSTMVAFLSPSLILLAVSPLLITVDLGDKSVHAWSETQCLEAMRQRGLGSILSKAGDILLGRIDNNIVDMPPTAAMCVASVSESANNLLDIFTLHSDASLRRWRLDTSVSLTPFEVNLLQVPSGPSSFIPSPSIWSPSYNSVALCARVYKSIYTLAIHVQTDGTDDVEQETQSNCKLMLLHGDLETGNIDSGVIQSSLGLSVPNEATSLVGMDFMPNIQRCSLRALFHSSPVSRDGASRIVLATYPPSMVSPVVTQPIVTKESHSLDGLAKFEKDRIRSLVFVDIMNAPGESIDDDIHELDRRFMQILFRPCRPRASGTVLAPKKHYIQKVLGKLVPSRDKDQEMSIELETLRAMHTWRKMENHGQMKFSSMTSPSPAKRTRPESNSTALSVYHSYFPSTLDSTQDQEESGIDMDEDEYEEDIEDVQRNTQLMAHTKRWKKFLLAVCEEEEVLRVPLALSLLMTNENAGESILVRAGVTTVLADAPITVQKEVNTNFGILDKVALEMLDLVENDREKFASLCEVETNAWNIVSKALLLLPSSPSPVYENQLRGIGVWSLSRHDGGKNKAWRNIKELLLGLDRGQILKWLERPPVLFGEGAEVSQTLPGLSLLSASRDGLEEGMSNTRVNRILPAAVRHAASSLSIACVDSVRRLQLGRCLLVLGFNQQGVGEAAFKAYLHSMSILWVCSQQVSVPSAAFQIKSSSSLASTSPSGSPPLKKSSSEGNVAVGLVSSQSKKTTALDAHMIFLSQKMDEAANKSSSQSPLGSILSLSRSFLNSTFSASLHDHRPVDAEKPFRSLWELGALPPPVDDSVASDYPRLALRLLAPFIKYRSSEESVHTNRARKVATAECLLIESNSLARSELSNQLRIEELREQACELLVSEVDGEIDDIELGRIEQIFHLLKNKTNEYGEGHNVSGNQEALQHAVVTLLTGNGKQPHIASEDIRRLCEQHVMRSIFLPLFTETHSMVPDTFEALGLDGDMLESVYMLIGGLLKISNLMHRLSILERHMSTVGRIDSSRSATTSDLLLAYIEKTITAMPKIVTPSVCFSMSEYASLWSMSFRHSMAGRQWKKAYSACLNNPVVERRISNYRRLVKGMVDAGALGELLHLCAVAMGQNKTVQHSTENEMGIESTGESIDLYEIAAETLEDACRTAVASLSADYRGCLYALHSSMGQWRRAGQAMDMKYLAVAEQETTPQGIEMETGEKASTNEDLAIENLSLASLGALHSIQLVEDTSQRFLVAGEVGPYPNLPFLSEAFGKDNTTLGRNNKRGRGNLAKNAGDSRMDHKSVDRLDNFMTENDMSRRAVRAMALRTLYLDSKTESFEPGFFRSSLKSVDSDRNIIDKLCELGYIDIAMLVSRAMKSTYEERTGGNRPNGRDVFFDSVSYMLCSHLIPMAVMSSRPEPGLAYEEETSTNSVARPTFAQLNSIVDKMDKSPRYLSCYTAEAWREQKFISNSLKGSVAMDLVRKIACSESNSSCPLALKVAEELIDLDAGRSRLPTWLERLLMGLDANDSGKNPGLFSERAKGGRDYSYRGDPAGLVRLYMKKGLYVDACNTVSSTLLGTEIAAAAESPRQPLASSRLPEKGDIDFVPYATIDVLWDLVDRSVRSGLLNNGERAKMIAAQKAMESALELHFNLMKISDMGTKSARALTN